MIPIKPLKLLFTELLSGDCSSLSAYRVYEEGRTKLYLNGRFYNMDPLDLLKSYVVNGTSVFKKVDGDFTLLVVEEDRIQIIRDRHGVGCQVFYSENFATSSLLDFTTLKGFECKPNLEALFTFMSIGFIPAPLCSLEGVKKLEAGHVLIINKVEQKVIDLFPATDFLSKTNTCTLNLDEATEEYERLHKNAIKTRIGSEIKVGLLLSGGYDSGGNISALRDLYDGAVTTFSIGFKDNQWTELPLAKILSERYKSRHYEYEIDGSEILNLPKIIKQTGDPFQEGGLFVNYTAMELVKNSKEAPALILGGDGNDQHFGTSGKELALHWKLKENGAQYLQNIFDHAGNLSMFEKDNILFRSEFHNRKILHVQQCDVFGFTAHQLNNFNVADFKYNKPAYLQNHPTKFNNFDEFYYNRNFNIDIKQVINNVILFKSSRMSELFGNSMTFPYMSTELYDFLATLPVDFKFHGTLDEMKNGKGVSKYLHKRYLKPKLPAEITNRKKQGGFAPLPIFLRDNEQRKEIFSYLRKSDLVKNLFKYHNIDQLLNQYDQTAGIGVYWFWNQQVKANQIINLLTLAVWWDMFINKKSSVSLINELY